MWKLLLFGALCFWGPEVALEAWTRQRPSAGTVTLLLPCTLVCGYAFTFLRAKHGRLPSAAVSMLLGVWVLGPLAMITGNTFLGGGFSNSQIGLALLTVLLGLFPIYTYIASTYDGSLYAVLIISLIMPLLHFALERDNWIVPPEWVEYFRRKKRRS